MLLNTGDRVASYEIVAPLGAGGMGEVYVARDSRLGRDVAIKVLPAAFAADPGRRARLEREARVLAAFSHPNIAAIYGVEEIPAGTALVLELVRGTTLDQRLKIGPLAPAEAIAIARQLADALDAAHERGIIHRDLKPANIMLGADGVVKVLDFGLATMVAEPESAIDPPATQLLVSMPGVVVGTPAYMSPEQARGQVVDKRTDVWAFGCVLFEMLAGRAAFGGGTISDVLAAVLEREPSWAALPPAARPIEPLLRRCLEKDVKRRVRDIGDVKLLLDDASVERATITNAPASTSKWLALTVASLVVGILAGGAAVWWRRAVVTPARVTRFEVSAFPGASFSTVAISADASRIAYTASRDGSSQLMVRDLSRLEATLIAGTEGAYDPFFSPDGRHIGFSTLTALKRVPTDGGPVTTICPVNAGFHGAAWAPDGTIVFAEDGGVGLSRVAASGGIPEKIAAPDASQGEEDYLAPAILPDGHGMLYTVRLAGGHLRIARRTSTGAPATLIESGFGAQYLSSGHLLFGEGERLMAVRYDLDTGQVIGSPVPVQESAFTKPADGISNIATAANGTALFVSGRNTGDMRRLVWLDRQGKRLGPAVAEALDQARNPRISTDGRRLAVTLGKGGRGNIWVFDLAGAAQPLKLTFKNHNTFPVWSPDGKRIAFLSVDASGGQVFGIASDGSALEPEQWTHGPSGAVPLAWSPDGGSLLFYGAQSRLWVLNVSDRSRKPWQPSRFEEFGAAFSPDGRSVAYGSNQSGRLEIWIRPFAGAGAAVRVSSDGGHDPVWARDGRELFYTNGPLLMSARVTADGDGIRTETPRALLDGGFTHDDADANIRFYDAAPDGRLLIIEAFEKSPNVAIVVVQHWGEELASLLPGR